MTSRLPTPGEGLAWSAIVGLAAVIAGAYFGDRLGLGVSPWLGVTAGLAGAVAMLASMRRRNPGHGIDLAAFLLVTAASLAYLLWLAWPALLPVGSGSDLTHHLLLVDYIERQGHLPHDASATEFLGEMADYTPGLHLLAVLAGIVSRTGGFHALYPVVAFAVALKYGLFALVLLRLLAGSPLRVPLAIAGVLAVLTASTYSLGSFVSDSFLAQVVSELFAVGTWWALVWWDDGRHRLALVLFAIAGIGVFLTWPIWIGPALLALALLIALDGRHPLRTRLVHGAIATIPVAVVVLVHTTGRSAQVSIVGTSGAVVPPSPAVLGWWLPLLSACGWIFAVATKRQRATVVFTVSIAAQAAALWAAATGPTPYMAIKMTYLAIYPAIALAIVLLDAVLRNASSRVPAVGRLAPPVLAWIVVFLVAAAARQELPTRSQVRPVVSNDLAAAGLWARTHVPVGCVDYLVGNEYTAYWLHLAVLGNPRISSRTGNDDTFLTQPSMARWLTHGSPRYAIANLGVLPAEIRGDVDILQQFGQAAAIERRGESACP